MVVDSTLILPTSVDHWAQMRVGDKLIYSVCTKDGLPRFNVELLVLQ